jgi:uncharacterized membrane protein required for colicin V production
MHNPVDDFFAHLSFNYFDILVVVWLLIGVLRGRKRGMSQELLPLTKWITLIIIAGLCYRFPAGLMQSYLGFSPVPANVTSYLLIAVIIQLIFSAIKNAIGEKIVGGDLFGRGEYYLGMIAGPLRFACMVIFLLSLLHARIVSKEELAETEKMQKQNFEDIRFPTYGSIQQAWLVTSLTGRNVQTYMPTLLINSPSNAPSSKKGSSDTIAHREQDTINRVLDGK